MVNSGSLAPLSWIELIPDMLEYIYQVSVELPQFDVLVLLIKSNLLFIILPILTVYIYKHLKSKINDLQNNPMKY